MIRYGGASKIGQTHIKNNIPNQDYFRIHRSKKRKKELILVVADGVGSHKYSQIGARAIANAVTTNAHLLYNVSNKKKFIKKTMKVFMKNIHPYKKDECGTTCIFSVIFKDRICLGQIGDGICCYKINDKFHILSDKDSDFLNETVSVTSRKSIDKWHFKSYNNPTCFQIMMATDGVADDLVPNMREIFLQRLNDSTRGGNHKEISELILKLFDNWERPLSHDDKTMILCFKEKDI